MTGAEQPRKRVKIRWLVAETMAVQAIGTMSVLTIPALAPMVARDLGLPANEVGYQIGIIYLAATLASLFASAFVGAFGPCRTGQIAMIMTAAGSALASLARVETIVAGSAILGFSYGLINPAASELLILHSPARRRNLIFSLKQTGVPIGGIAAGMIGPQVALALSWHAALLLAAILALSIAAFSQLGRRALDSFPLRPRPRGIFSLESFRVVARSQQLLWLALSSLCFSAVQLCVIAFLVVLLVEDLRFDLVTAGALLAAVQVVGALGRVLWGVVADRLRDGIAVLFWLAMLMTAASLAVALFGPKWPPNAIVAPLLVLGLSAVGWNGVYLSEIAHRSPAQFVSATTGAAMFFTFAGVVAGPSAFSLLHNLFGQYTASYWLLVAVSFSGGLMVLAARNRSPADVNRSKIS